MVSLLLVTVLVACGGDDTPTEERRFANDPLPTVDPSTVPTAAPTDVPAASATVAPPAVSPEALLVARGAPKHVYFLDGSDLWMVAPDGTGARRLLAAGDQEIRAFAVAPNGSRVAALLVQARTDGDDAEAVSVVVLDADGKETRRVEGLEAAAGGAPGIRAESLDWSPQGDQLLATFTGGGLVALPPDGEPWRIVPPARAPFPIWAEWSPSGDAVAFLARSEEDAPPRLYVAPFGTGAEAGEPIQVAPEADRPERGVGAFAWVPDGSGLLFTETGGRSPAGGDLYRVAPTGEERELVVSARAAAPVAGILEFAPSPDGRAVAFTVAVPGDAGPIFDSLWVQTLAGGRPAEVPIPPDQVASALRWTSRGLVWRSTPTGQEVTPDLPFALLRADSSGQTFEVFRDDPGKGATPETSPESSPVASPLASPEGTPG